MLAISKNMSDLEELMSKIDQFATDRDWTQFHSPKNLAASISIEAEEIPEDVSEAKPTGPSGHHEGLHPSRRLRPPMRKVSSVMTDTSGLYFQKIQASTSTEHRVRHLGKRGTTSRVCPDDMVSTYILTQFSSD